MNQPIYIELDEARADDGHHQELDHDLVHKPVHKLEADRKEVNKNYYASWFV